MPLLSISCYVNEISNSTATYLFYVEEQRSWQREGGTHLRESRSSICSLYRREDAPGGGWVGVSTTELLFSSFSAERWDIVHICWQLHL